MRDSGGNGGIIAVSGNTMLVASTNEDSRATTINGDQQDNSAYSAGAADVFVRKGNKTWSQQATYSLHILYKILYYSLQTSSLIDTRSHARRDSLQTSSLIDTRFHARRVGERAEKLAL